MEKLSKVAQFYYNTKKVHITKPDWIKLRKVQESIWMNFKG